MELKEKTNGRNYTMMNVRPEQLRRIKVAAALRGITMVELLDNMLDSIEQETNEKTCEDK